LSDKDYIEDLFSKSLNEYGSAVRPELWNALQTKLASNAVASSGAVVAGKSLLLKGIIGTVSLGAIGVGTYFIFHTKNVAPTENKQEVKTEIIMKSTPEIVKETPTSTPSIQKHNNTVVKEEQHKEMVYPHPSFIAPSKVANNVPVKTNEGKSTHVVSSPSKTVVETPIPTPKTTSDIVTKGEETPKAVADPVTKAVSTTSTSTKVSDGYVKEWSKTNVFTPNGDGVNDYFFLETNHLSDFSISILNSKNEVVFKSSDPKFRWDGTDIRTNEKVDEGTYFYLVFAEDENGNPIKQYNTLFIKR